MSLDQFHDSIEALNDALQSAEQRMLDLGVRVSASVMTPVGEFAFRKRGSEWGLAVGEVTLQSASLECRIVVADFLDALEAALVARRVEVLQDINASARKAREFASKGRP